MANEPTIYGDENLGYVQLARDMTPSEASYVLETCFNDGIVEQMDSGRVSALRKRSLEGGIKG